MPDSLHPILELRGATWDCLGAASKPAHPREQSAIGHQTAQSWNTGLKLSPEGRASGDLQQRLGWDLADIRQARKPKQDLALLAEEGVVDTKIVKGAHWLQLSLR